MDFLQFNAANSGEQHFITSTVTVGNGGGKRKKSCGNYNSCSGANIEDFGQVPVRQRSQANARERDRTHSDGTKPISVNTAFSTLRTLIPTEPKDRKLSKIETLRLASSYISHLGTQLMAGPIDQPCLRLHKSDEDPSSTVPGGTHQVCTFCIAHKKSPKMDNFDYTPNYEGIFLSPSPSGLVTSQVTANDLIYYQ